ncbi:hypothetical protein BDY19DRAFT_985512 [Irpex rosettiformis]|uniref:Uncharacterized protein n=1 Tax=Irpex rosettiformis TaxID=378272 RepID=A0ACB8U3A2_9APHY|nr:hypothetical protein BDY19DRAFT_985512 [Irpex rosettiformis]
MLADDSITLHQSLCHFSTNILEKGAYRLRSSKRKTAKPTPLRARADSRASLRDAPIARYEKQMATLVVFLICATVTCFGTAYYLFTTRWDPDLRPTTRTLSSDPASQTQVIDFDLASTLTEPQSLDELSSLNEKYLTYLPHSGFHNQRIAFENALVLSRLLNRTLLVPPVRLGNAFLSYGPFDVLQEMLVLSDKRNLQHCKAIAREHGSEDCVDYHSYTQVPWDWLVDLSEIRRHQKLVGRWNFTDEWLYSTLGFDDENVFSLADTSRDTYGYQDFDPLSVGNSLGRKYQYMIHLSTLALREERLVHLGSLFGSSRLHLRDLQNLAVRKTIRQDMARLNPLLLDVANLVQQSMNRFYIGAHIRLGDGTFQENALRNSRLVWWKIVHGVLGFSIEETLAIERRFAETGLFENLEPPEETLGDWDQPSSPASFYQPSSQPSFSNVATCEGPLHVSSSLRPLNVPLFISSDAEEPRNNFYLRLFTRTFPCTFFLSDFPNETTSLDGLQNSLDGLFLKPFLLPFIDALVVARGQTVVGTEGSTYSRFVEDVLWRTYHGYEIVQKG